MQWDIVNLRVEKLPHSTGLEAVLDMMRPKIFDILEDFAIRKRMTGYSTDYTRPCKRELQRAVLDDIQGTLLELGCINFKVIHIERALEHPK